MFAAALILAAAVVLPGEPVERPALAPVTFPDVLSAVVWRNWLSVPAARIAAATGVPEADVRTVAAEMGLPPDPPVPSEWTTKGYITTLRANWHLLDYEAMMKLIGKDRAALRTCLLEEDFLFTKLGRLKPKCAPVAADLAAGRAARREIAAVVKAEGLDDFSEEPRFAFLRELSSVPADAKPASTNAGLRLIFSYFADYVDPLGDDAVGSYPDGLLARLADQGVNAVWLHVVLAMLSEDPAFPEFGDGAARRLANLRKLVARAKRRGIRVFLYLNEPRPQPEAFFAVKGREGMKGVPGRNGVWSMCTKAPETRRWLSESIERVFREVPGLGGIFTITASENLTNCASHWERARCPRCRAFTNGEVIGDVNRLMIDAMHRAAPEAEAVVYNWGWPPDTAKDAFAIIPTNRVSMLAVSERGVPIMRGGVANKVNEYSVSSPGPSPEARTFWTAARAAGFKTAAKVQSGVTWELSPFPYLPVAELVAEHARNLAAEKVDGFVLSWSLGSYPAPNLKLFSNPDLQRFSQENYGTTEGMDAVWKAFADGFREYPFDINCAYFGPQHMGPANPLYAKPTGWEATMVGMPYDDLKKWRSLYPEDVWIAQMDKAATGFARGCELFAAAIGRMPETKRAEARRELGVFRAATLHLASAADQGRFVQARNRGDKAAMRAVARRELQRAKELLKLVRADSRIGYECSNSYFYTPQDLREKVVNCRALLEGGE